MPTKTTAQQTTAQKATAAGARRPADRRDSTETKQKRLEEYEGAQFLTPLSKVPVWDQLELQSYLLTALGDEVAEAQKGEEVDVSKIDPAILPKLGGVVKHVAENFTVDKDGFTEFVSGTGAMNRALDLVMAYVGEMGEG